MPSALCYLEHRAPHVILIRFRKHCCHKEMAGVHWLRQNRHCSSGHYEDSIEAYELSIGNFSGGLMLGDMPKGRPQTWLAFMGIAALGVIGLSVMALLSF
jgi:hypothetical protein